MHSAQNTPIRGIVAVAPDDPLHKRTFSGLSANVFAEIQRQEVPVEPLATRDLRWYDALQGAVLLSEALKTQSRKVSRVNPDWFWSRRAHDSMTRRFMKRLRLCAPDSAVLQIGTHVQAAGTGRPVYCLTDLTVAQALSVGRVYQVGRASKKIQQEALECQREVFHGCDRVFVLSEWAARSVVEDYGLPAGKVLAVGAGANVPSRLPPRKRNESAPSILFVGLDWEQKGGPLLLGAFRRVRAQVPTARLVIVGCRPSGLDSEPGVEVLGRLNRSLPEEEQRLLNVYAEATCFCIAPAVDAFPNVLLEAGAFGVPVVSTDLGSRGEVVIDRVTGRLVPHDDAGALAEALTELLSDPAMADRYGAAAAQRVREKMNWPHVVREMLTHMGVGACPRSS